MREESPDALFGRKVLRHSCRLLNGFKEKEWWFSFLHDERSGVYCSWAFVRSCLTDHFAFLCLDRAGRQLASLERNLLLDRARSSGLELRHASRALDIAFLAGDGEKCRFRMRAANLEADLVIDGSNMLPFCRQQTDFVHRYGLIHVFNSNIEGRLQIGANCIQVSTRQTYRDHCYGIVPRRSRWHWLAATDGNVSLASLVNYGADGQVYTQYCNGTRWHRLSPAVCFEPAGEFAAAPPDHWCVSSPDMEVHAHATGTQSRRVRIPPVVGGLIDITHREHRVSAAGRVRVDGVWETLPPLNGVLEEHHGVW